MTTMIVSAKTISIEELRRLVVDEGHSVVVHFEHHVPRTFPGEGLRNYEPAMRMSGGHFTAVRHRFPIKGGVSDWEGHRMWMEHFARHPTCRAATITDFMEGL